jgi:hypothetical protein
VPIVLKSGSLNLLEPSGPVKACNGISLPLPNKASKWQMGFNLAFKGLWSRLNFTQFRNLIVTYGYAFFAAVGLSNINVLNVWFISLLIIHSNS